MTFGSLFSGIGGLDLGFERAGWECAWQIEIDPFCRQVLAARFPGVKQFEDITKTPTQDLERVDALVGGFPCQDLSQAGKRAGIEGTRSGLWFEYARIIGDLRPRIVVIENVPGLLVPGAIGRVVGELARLGYVGCWRSIRAAELGASHLRKRVFIVAHLADSSSRGLGERGQPSRSNGQLDGRYSQLANSEIDLGRREQVDLSGRAIPTGARASSAAGGTLAHSGLTEHRRAAESPGFNRQRTPDDDRRPSRTLGNVPDPEGARPPDPDIETVQRARRFHEGRGPEQLRRAPEAMADSDGVGRRQRGQSTQPNTRHELINGFYLPFAPGPADPRWPRILAERADLCPSLPKTPQSAVRGMADGVPDPLDGALSNRTKRLRALGNAVVPQIAEWIGERINSLYE